MTHDRYLIERVATHIWDIVDGELLVFEGAYANYREAKTTNVRIAREPTVTRTRRHCRTKKAEPKENIDDIEAAIDALECEIQDLGQRLENAFETRNAIKIKEWKEHYLAKQRELDDKLRTWERISTSS